MGTEREEKMIDTKTMQVYKTRCGNIVGIESFKRLNNGKKLTFLQEKLLGLIKIKIKTNKGKK